MLDLGLSPLDGSILISESLTVERDLQKNEMLYAVNSLKSGIPLREPIGGFENEFWKREGKLVEVMSGRRFEMSRVTPAEAEIDYQTLRGKYVLIMDAPEPQRVQFHGGMIGEVFQAPVGGIWALITEADGVRVVRLNRDSKLRILTLSPVLN